MKDATNKENNFYIWCYRPIEIIGNRVHKITTVKVLQRNLALVYDRITEDH